MDDRYTVYVKIPLFSTEEESTVNTVHSAPGGQDSVSSCLHQIYWHAPLGVMWLLLPFITKQSLKSYLDDM